MRGNYKTQLAATRRKLTGNLTAGFQDAAVYVASRLIVFTPVDTGRLRGGWSLRINQLPDADGVNLDKVGAKTLQAIRAAAKQLKIGDTAHIANLTPYGPFVDSGTVRMAPRLIVVRAQADAKLRMREIVLKRLRGI